MAMTINTNVASLNAQRNLAGNSSSLTTSMQRLSSGLRVNSAKDDAAGLAIADRMNTQIKGMNVAARNANDGISLAQTAEGSLGKIGDMLQRMRELAVQSRNSSNSTDDRTALQTEVAQLKEELERVAVSSKFNGKNLLDGTFTSAKFQVGANANETIDMSGVASAKLTALGSLSSATVTGAAPSLGTVADGAFSINGVSIGAVTAGGTAAAQGANVAAAINAKSESSGVTAAADGAGLVTLTSLGSSSIVVAGTVTNTGLTAGTTAATSATGINALSVSTAGGAAQAIDGIDAALKTINSERSKLGAIQSRFETTIANIQITSENLSAARGRIVDADFATESSNLSRSQVLQQAGTAMIAQANQLPQQVLQLLRG